MTKRDVVALLVMAGGVVLVVLGCRATYGLLREYADVCGDTPAVVQVWAGAGLGPFVAALAVGIAFLMAAIGRRGMRYAGAALVAGAVVGATFSGAAGIADKRAAYEDDPTIYGDCRGYNS